MPPCIELFGGFSASFHPLCGFLGLHDFFRYKGYFFDIFVKFKKKEGKIYDLPVFFI
jgi:hypothetical protein